MRTERTRNAGFTLLELVVAVAIFAAVAVMSYGGLAALVRAEEGLAAHARDWSELQLALQFVETDLAQSVARPVRDALGGTLPAMQLTTGGSTELSFSRLGSGILVGSVSQLQRVAYIWQNGRLSRRLWLHADQVQGGARQDALLLKDMDGLDIAFVDAAGQRLPAWPPAEGGPTDLPRALELTLEHPRIGAIRRLLLVQP